MEAYSQTADTLWTQTYGGYYSDKGYSVQQTSDGGYILAGQTSSFGAGGWDAYLIKTDAYGDTSWTKTYGGDGLEACYSVQQTDDEGYILTGWTDSFGRGTVDIFLIKTDAYGEAIWTRIYGGISQDRGYSVRQIKGGGYIVAGVTSSFGAGGDDVYLIKTNSLGDTLWARAFGGAAGDGGYSVQETSDDGFVVTGWTESFSAGYEDVYLLKIDSGGDTLWTRSYGGESFDWGESIQQVTDGGYIITGSTASFGAGGNDVYLMRTDGSGEILWSRTYGGATADDGYSVQETADGGYIVTATTFSYGDGGSDFYLIKTDAYGDTLWTGTYGGPSNERASSIQITADGGYIVAGSTHSFGEGDYDIWLIRLDSETGIDERVNRQVPSGFFLSQNFPNPFNTATSIDFDVPAESDIDIAVYDVLGRRVATLLHGQKQPGRHNVIWDAGAAASGIYFGRLQAGSMSQSIRMTLLK